MRVIEVCLVAKRAKPCAINFDDSSVFIFFLCLHPSTSFSSFAQPVLPFLLPFLLPIPGLVLSFNLAFLSASVFLSFVCLISHSPSFDSLPLRTKFQPKCRRSLLAADAARSFPTKKVAEITWTMKSAALLTLTATATAPSAPAHCPHPRFRRCIPPRSRLPRLRPRPRPRPALQ